WSRCMIRKTTRAIGRRASCSVCAMTCGSRTMCAAKGIATSPRYPACGGLERSLPEETSMPTKSFHHPQFVLAITLGLSLAAWGGPAAAQTATGGKIPELASSTFAWIIIRPEWLPPPAGLRGPIPPDPDQRQHMNQDGAGQVTVRLG